MKWCRIMKRGDVLLQRLETKQNKTKQNKTFCEVLTFFFFFQLRFATAGRYRACIKFEGFAIQVSLFYSLLDFCLFMIFSQSKNTTIHIHTSGFGNKVK